MKIGVISDTHGLMREEALAALRGARAIVHAGDIGNRAVLDALSEIAPVSAIRGNNDRGPWAGDIPEQRSVTFGEAKIYLLHDRNDLPRYPVPAGCNVFVTGHSHQPRIERRDGMLYLNPGSAGPRRFKLPITIAWLTTGATLDAEIVVL